MWVETEFINAVVTDQALTEKTRDRGDALRKLVQRRFGSRTPTRDTPVFVDFADDSGDLLGRCAAARIGQQ
ncbi:hypothetical protein NJB1907f44_06070 [Mycobacterium marinum]|nr:hypothetical protein MMRN_08380 [Mycobacterium marinum]GJO00225.1 hypothetical protein NJB1907E90_01980 [Mycobacterium marinum]GJO01320.1 hypothetical protein NJB1808e29_23560 [Mycobacterium marinum]GJO06234.1 hypothetical protein NJB1907f34b_30270 [Mycobacterium marinum]GJO13337.1 hypothetical protein NJB1907E11_08200 [Mycobacterium marinum]